MKTHFRKTHHTVYPALNLLLSSILSAVLLMQNDLIQWHYSSFMFYQISYTSCQLEKKQTLYISFLEIITRGIVRLSVGSDVSEKHHTVQIVEGCHNVWHPSMVAVQGTINIMLTPTYVRQKSTSFLNLLIGCRPQHNEMCKQWSSDNRGAVTEISC